MKFKVFKEVIEEMKKSHEVMDSLYNYIRPETFDHHNSLISMLLTELYGETVVNYVLNEWLTGNTSPIVFTQDDGSTIEAPLKTIRDLYKVMEDLKQPGTRAEKDPVVERVRAEFENFTTK